MAGSSAEKKTAASKKKADPAEAVKKPKAPSASKKAAPKAAKSTKKAPAGTTLKEESLFDEARSVESAEPSGTVVEPADSPRPRRDQGDALERGDLFFFYRPDVDEEAPTGILDVRRFHVVLRPEGGETVRVITVGRKTLPTAEGTGANHWAFVDRVLTDADEVRQSLGAFDYETETTGDRHLPAARPAGEGVYAIVQRGRDSILAYALELPEELGEVQKAFGIEREGRFVVSIKNPQGDSPEGLGLDDDQQANLPDDLQRKFGSRKWHPANPVQFLDHPGVELILIGGRLEPDADLGIDLDPQPEDEEQAEVFRDLHLDKSDRTIKPLFDGEWA